MSDTRSAGVPPIVAGVSPECWLPTDVGRWWGPTTGSIRIFAKIGRVFPNTVRRLLPMIPQPLMLGCYCLLACYYLLARYLDCSS